MSRIIKIFKKVLPKAMIQTPPSPMDNVCNSNVFLFVFTEGFPKLPFDSNGRGRLWAHSSTLNEVHQYIFKWFITGLPLELVYQKLVGIPTFVKSLYFFKGVKVSPSCTKASKKGVKMEMFA